MSQKSATIEQIISQLREIELLTSLASDPQGIAWAAVSLVLHDNTHETLFRPV